ncbi:hypothetical protein TgHK011_003584 [Trichoderma gracile]|nr:hypothetical protein TgHK011_003584 [Trichoderma gracile]
MTLLSAHRRPAAAHLLRQLTASAREQHHPGGSMQSMSGRRSEHRALGMDASMCVTRAGGKQAKPMPTVPASCNRQRLDGPQCWNVVQRWTSSDTPAARDASRLLNCHHHSAFERTCSAQSPRFTVRAVVLSNPE